MTALGLVTVVLILTAIAVEGFYKATGQWTISRRMQEWSTAHKRLWCYAMFLFGGFVTFFVMHFSDTPG